MKKDNRRPQTFARGASGNVAASHQSDADSRMPVGGR